MTVRVMSVYSIWPYFVCLVALLAIAATPILKLADTPPNPRGARLSALDGLRGFLALSVFFHHAAIYHDRLIDGSWKLPPSNFYTLLGQVGVAMFFMITGYLFWDRVVRTEGRPDWTSLYVGRVFRIGPLYLFATVTMLAIVFLHTGPHLNVTGTRLAEQIGRWLMLGFILGPDDVNGFVGAAIGPDGNLDAALRMVILLSPATNRVSGAQRTYAPALHIGRTRDLPDLCRALRRALDRRTAFGLHAALLHWHDLRISDAARREPNTARQRCLDCRNRSAGHRLHLFLNRKPRRPRFAARIYVLPYCLGLHGVWPPDLAPSPPPWRHQLRCLSAAGPCLHYRFLLRTCSRPCFGIPRATLGRGIGLRSHADCCRHNNARSR